jgi:hypothetical protein
MNVFIQIDEIVLFGFGTHNRYRIAETVEHELIRIFTENDYSSLLTGSQETHYLDAGHFELGLRSSEKVLATYIAQSISAGLIDQQHHLDNG